MNKQGLSVLEVLRFFGDFPTISIKSQPWVGASIDSRTLHPGELFVAIAGERVDGHDFIDMAFERGACAALVNSAKDVNHPLCIAVDDTQKALQDLAAWYRTQLTIPIAALTGSCGKTTTKEMTAAILREVLPVFATPGNKNNHVGVPLSILQCTTEYEAAVFELGANHQGEISHNVQWVKPQIALITNVGSAHIGEFGGVHAIFRAKSEIFEGLPTDGSGVAIYNADDAFAPQWKAYFAHHSAMYKTLTFGLHPKADIRATNIDVGVTMCASFVLETPQGSVDIQLSVPGKHNVLNALAAAAIALSFPGIRLQAIGRGLAAFQSVSGRMAIQQGIAGARVIDDSYNANLKSVEAAIEVLAGFSGKRYLVLGDMGELGEWSLEHHRLIGEKAKHVSLDAVFTCGKLSQRTGEAFGGMHYHFDNLPALITHLKDYLDSHTTVLVKGSLSARMKDVVSAITLGTSL